MGIEKAIDLGFIHHVWVSLDCRGSDCLILDIYTYAMLSWGWSRSWDTNSFMFSCMSYPTWSCISLEYLCFDWDSSQEDKYRIFHLWHHVNLKFRSVSDEDAHAVHTVSNPILLLVPWLSLQLTTLTLGLTSSMSEATFTIFLPWSLTLFLTSMLLEVPPLPGTCSNHDVITDSPSLWSPHQFSYQVLSGLLSERPHCHIATEALDPTASQLNDSSSVRIDRSASPCLSNQSNTVCSEGDCTPSLVSPCSEGFSRSLLTGVCAPLAAVRVHPPAFCPLFPSSNHLSRLTACSNSTEHHRSGFGQFIRTPENTIGIINCWQWELMCHWWALAQLREVENLLTEGLL